MGGGGLREGRLGAMRQRKLGSHTPPCHRRMVITTLFSVLSVGGGRGSRWGDLGWGSQAARGVYPPFPLVWPC